MGLLGLISCKQLNQNLNGVIRGVIVFNANDLLHRLHNEPYIGLDIHIKFAKSSWWQWDAGSTFNF